MSPSKIVSPDEAAARIPSGVTLAVGGSGHLLQAPDGLLAALERRFAASSEPRDLTVVHTMGLGNNA
jgi:propionate CoA-transferase